MKRFLQFFKTPLGHVVGLATLIVVGAFLIHAANSREKLPAMNKAPTQNEPMERHTIVREGTPLRVPPKNVAPVAQQSRANDGDAAISRPHAARAEQTQTHGAAKKREAAVLPISLLPTNHAGAGATESVSSNFAPYGRLIPCETIVTLESSRIDTPIIGLITEDVWHDGRLIIPAGAEVHGRAATDRARERIAASGQWIIVWRDHTNDNGNELTINGIALDRERNEVLGEFGPRDGSAGLVGQVIKSDDWQEIKLFASTFIAGMASGLQNMENTGVGVAIPQATAKNAALAGTADVLNAYAAQIQKRIQEEGFYVRVPAGKQFYLYVTQTLDKAKAVRGNGAARLWQENENTTTTSP